MYNSKWKPSCCLEGGGEGIIDHVPFLSPPIRALDTRTQTKRSLCILTELLVVGTITFVFATNHIKLKLSEFMQSIAANLHCCRKDHEGNYHRDRSTLQNVAASGIVCINIFNRTFSSKNCVFTGKHDQKCRRSSESELYCNFSSFCSLEGTKSIKKESKYMISNTLRLSWQHCNLKGRKLPKRSHTTTDIADKVILGKEISKSVKWF